MISTYGGIFLEFAHYNPVSHVQETSSRLAVVTGL